MRRVMQKRATALGELTEFQRLSLLLAMPPGAFRNQEEEREAWEANKDTLLREFLQLKGLFKRPKCWWAYEAREARKLISDPKGLIISWNRLYLGMPDQFYRPPVPPDGPRFESTRAYLLRLNLPLLPPEQDEREKPDPFRDGIYPGQEERTPAQWREWAKHVQQTMKGKK